MIGETRGKNLGFIFQTPEGASVDDAVAVALKIVAVAVGQFRVAAPARCAHRKSQMRKLSPLHRISRYFWDNSPMAVKAIRLTAERSVRRGSSSFRASSGLVRASA
jgi:hypothetical protein